MTKKINEIVVFCMLSIVLVSCSFKPSTNIAEAWLEKNFDNNVEIIKFNKVNGVESEENKIEYYVMYFDATIRFKNDWIDNSPSYSGKEYKKGDEYKIDLGSINFMRTDNGWIATTVNFKENNGFIKIGNTIDVLNQSNILQSAKSQEKPNESKEEKWQIFLKEFKGAVNSRNTEKIIKLTSKDFFSGGSGYPIKEWLRDIVFVSNESYSDFKNTLQGTIKSYKKADGSFTKSTGTNSYGDIFFIYEKGYWLFGGVIGD